MNRLLQVLMLGGVGVSMLVACSANSIEDESLSLNATTTTVQAQDLTMNDLLGTWNMFSMTSVPLEEGGTATAVDFDQDANFTYNLLEETDCFDPMFFDFKSSGEVTTFQSRLFFSEVTGAFNCQTTGNYAATYSVSGDQLTVTFTIDGQTYTETKTVNRYSENGSEFLKVKLTKEETNTAVYVAKDPGNTVASDIQKIDIIYKKQ
ncbi:hypothetical protein [Salinimicrobium terrae]|uniref:hypothetical protein n=1 Tax=Salinimicrobium terrae TaxID=470866 RepID=UPI00048E3A3E|nr:hypothetical protein [Salinimicrobium terrae]